MDGNQPNLLTLNGSSPSPTVLKRSNAANVENNVANNGNKLSSLIFSSRSPSPQPESNPTSNGNAQPKPNQVSTVLLYGIPIVSLYIESQERLCLAQISNTLLKQFSYNEIHNRRVALGITCVQCTPVQLEILRRAGAMPVSSRRCGMITRREAERLCKSFLGDNSPPRLPDDFSFGVFHECAWGCRGAFLPSRYNSSRAKCIKCTYCGLFFSPNKFIFHSHRLTPNDKYVQPDAANFNSWRRHLRLSGTPPDDVTHAWEDVKAMFNGGTRKRLMSTPMSSLHHSSSASSGGGANKRVKENPANPPLAIAAAAAAAITQFPLRPIIHQNPTPQPQTPVSNSTPVSSASTASPNNPTNTRLAQPPTAFPQDLPFSISRSFMIDYMWHHHHQQQQQNQGNNPNNTPSNIVSPPTKANQFQFPPYSALSWIKQPPSSFLFKPNPSGNDDKPAFNHFSAFKPVINMRVDATETSAPTSVISGNVNQSQSPSSSTSSYNHTTTSSNNQSDDEVLTPIKQDHRKKYQRFGNQKETNYIDVEDDEDSNQMTVNESKLNGPSDTSNENDNNLKEQMISDDENEVVDIETTEDDDVQIHDLQPYKTSNNYHHHEDAEEIEVLDDKNLDLENNNNNVILEENDRCIKSRIVKLSTANKQFEETKVDSDPEEFQHKKSRRSPFNNNNDWTLNLKKEPIKLDVNAPLQTQEYSHHPHKAKPVIIEDKPNNGSLSKILSTFGPNSNNNDEPIPLIPTTTASNELWSVARLSLECNNNRDEHLRNSFYHHLNQIQQRGGNGNTIHHPLHHITHYHQHNESETNNSSHTSIV